VSAIVANTSCIGILLRSQHLLSARASLPSVDGTGWLDESEMRAWRNYVEVVNDVSAALEDDLITSHGLTLGDYQVLVYLSEAAGRSLRMCDLAGRLGLSPSGLTRRLDGLVRGGLVAREPSAEDRRVTLAVLTPAGFERLAAAAPDHVASVRRQLLDHLTAAQVDALGAAFEAIRSGRSARMVDSN
jgi:DNA-binding MarR family transcriptional regulator